MRLLRPIEPEYNGAVYIVDQTKRYYLRDGGIARAHNLNIEDIINVPAQELYGYDRGQWAPNIWPDHIVNCPPLDLSSHDMREIITQNLHGSGVEIGAYNSPFPLPLRCRTTYADHLTFEQLVAAADPDVDVHEIVRPSIIAHFEDLTAVEEESCDYFVASHVIEHTRSPITCIHDALGKLRPDGSLVLVVPDKNKTFDRDRTLTSLEHLILDHVDYKAERDAEHYLEFLNKVKGYSGTALVDAVLDAIAKNENIHYHTWDYESFSTMIDYIVEARRSGAKPVRTVRSHPTRRGDAAFEFYFTLTV